MNFLRDGASVSDLDILREELGFLNETALLVDHLMDLEFSDTVGYRAHTIIDFLLAHVRE